MLKAYATHRRTQGLIADVVRPKSEYSVLLGAKILAFSGGESGQDSLIVSAPDIDLFVARTTPGVGWHRHCFVHDAHLAVIMQHTFIDADTRKYGGPEFHVRPQFFRHGEYVILRLRRLNKQQETGQKRLERTIGTCHLHLIWFQSKNQL